MPYIQEDSSSGRLQLTIPKDVAILKGWKKGTKLEFHEIMNNTCLVEVRR